jgi:two-component system, response regulator PdtaR
LKILEARPDVRLLFTDIQMPGGCGGMDLARQVHAAGRTSCWSSPRGTRSPAEIPDDGRFIAKPYKAEELFIAIRGFDANAAKALL